jgi:hypothetical protein
VGACVYECVCASITHTLASSTLFHTHICPDAQATTIPTIKFETINTAILEKVIQYFYYKKKYDHTPPPLPQFKIGIDSMVDLLNAASFLDT